MTGKSVSQRTATSGTRPRAGGKRGSTGARVKGAASAGGRAAAAAVASHLGVGSVIRSSGSERPVRETGTDWVADVSITSSTVTDSVVLNWWVSPTNISGRIASIARQWERWMPHKLNFKFVSMVPATTAGAVTVWHDPDVDDDTPAAPVVASAFASDSFASGPVWESFDVPIRTLDTKTLLYTRDRGAGEADDRLEYAGQIYVAYTGPTVASNVVLGRLLVEYDIEFSKRCWEDTPSISFPVDATPLSLSGAAQFIVSAAQAAGVLNTDRGINVTSKGIEVKPGNRAAFRLISNLLPSTVSPGAATGTFRAILRRTADALEAVPEMRSMLGDLASATEMAGLTYPFITRNAVAYNLPTGIAETFVNYIEFMNDLSYPVYLDWVTSWTASSLPDKAGAVTGVFLDYVDIDIVPHDVIAEHSRYIPATGTFYFASNMGWGSFSTQFQTCTPEAMPSVTPPGYTLVTPPATTAERTTVATAPSGRSPGFLSVFSR